MPQIGHIGETGVIMSRIGLILPEMGTICAPGLCGAGCWEPLHVRRVAKPAGWLIWGKVFVEAPARVLPRRRISGVFE
jgi:hypothetical protein